MVFSRHPCIQFCIVPFGRPAAPRRQTNIGLRAVLSISTEAVLCLRARSHVNPNGIILDKELRKVHVGRIKQIEDCDEQGIDYGCLLGLAWLVRRDGQGGSVAAPDSTEHQALMPAESRRRRDVKIEQHFKLWPLRQQKFASG